MKLEDFPKDILIDALLIDNLTRLGTRRAYEEADNLPIQVGIDHVGLHDINEEFGRGMGDWILCRSADIVMRHVDEAYRIFSDKFVFQAVSYGEAQKSIEAILLDLSSVDDVLKVKDGEKYRVSGISIYYGMAGTMNEAFIESSNKKRDLKSGKIKQ